MANGKNYDVGYGKPPQHTQFKPGCSGNPKGRPKGRRNLKTDVLDMLRAPVRVRENGKSKIVRTQQAALMRLREKALGGDVKAMDQLLRLASTFNADELPDEAAAALESVDQEILDAYSKKLARRQENDPSAQNASYEEKGDD